MEELAKEDAADGIDGARAADELRRSMRETAARSLRESQPSRRPSYVTPSALARHRPDLDALKALVLGVFARQPALGMAFRDGKKQSDEDWQSLYDDLVDMGAIGPDINAD